MRALVSTFQYLAGCVGVWSVVAEIKYDIHHQTQQMEVRFKFALFRIVLPYVMHFIFSSSDNNSVKTFFVYLLFGGA